jgi:eukaryotic-like serine/threonine-protein kinase
MSEVEAPKTGLRKAPGTMIDGRYRIDGVVGAGGFAIVYRATQINLDQPVAIKVLGMRVADPEVFVKRFLREAKTAAQIRHPGIVNILDFGVTSEAEPYMVLELLEGKPLYNYLVEDGPMEPARVRNLFVHCLDGLQAAHEQGIVHRDLKPGNLFVTGIGTMAEALRILDFGCAFAMDDQNRLTGTNARIGTPQYLAPEYAQHHAISPALDVYQMGLIFVECLTGEPAVDAENPYQCIMAHCGGNLQIPTVLLDSSLGPVVRKALAINVNERYQTAGEFRDALQSLAPEALPVVISADPVGRVDIADTPGGIPPETLEGIVTLGSDGPVVVPAPAASQGAVVREPSRSPRGLFLALAAAALLLGGVLAAMVVVSIAGQGEDTDPAGVEAPAVPTAVTPVAEAPADPEKKADAVAAVPDEQPAPVPDEAAAPKDTPPEAVAGGKARRKTNVRKKKEAPKPPAADPTPVKKKRGLGFIEDDGKKKIGILD